MVHTVQNPPMYFIHVEGIHKYVREEKAIFAHGIFVDTFHLMGESGPRTRLFFYPVQYI